MTTLSKLLKVMLDFKASDMHLTVGSPPVFRVNGRVVRAKTNALTAAESKDLCYSVLTDYQKALFEEHKQLDFSFGIKELARFRANLFFQRGTVAGAFRFIPFKIPTLEESSLPATVVKHLVQKPRGLLLITGATGSGKTTTLASLLNYLNDHESYHIVTIEDPIEYIHSHRKCIINQREVGQDTRSFSLALKGALREDPDVVMVGEMRDKETIETALTLAETGHLVLSTLHTNSASQTITRIIQGFPPDSQDQIRVQLSMVLEGIISQALLEKADASGRALAYEILVPNTSIRNLIRENKIFQIQSAMLVGQDTSGMITFNQSLGYLVKSRQVSLDTALSYSPDPDDLLKMFPRRQVA